jgi:ComF family protein
LDLIFPPRGTNVLVQGLSPLYLKTIALEDGALPYQREEVKALIWELKYYANPKAAVLAGEHLAETLMSIASEELGKPLLIPIPMHSKRRHERGHNQTELLCKAALHYIRNAYEYRPHLLERTRHTASQQGLERHARLTNVLNSMQIKNPSSVIGRVCVVVDDVATTGATLFEAHRALREAGARTVHTVSLARS